jgi:hypothetical protein
VDINAQAANQYDAIKGLPGMAARVDARRQALGVELMEGKNRLEVTSFTLNGQSAAGTLRATRDEQLAILNRLFWMLDNSATLASNRTQPVF